MLHRREPHREISIHLHQEFSCAQHSVPQIPLFSSLRQMEYFCNNGRTLSHHLSAIVQVVQQCKNNGTLFRFSTVVPRVRDKYSIVRIEYTDHDFHLCQDLHQTLHPPSEVLQLIFQLHLPLYGIDRYLLFAK